MSSVRKESVDFLMADRSMLVPKTFPHKLKCMGIIDHQSLRKPYLVFAETVPYYKYTIAGAMEEILKALKNRVNFDACYMSYKKAFE